MAEATSFQFLFGQLRDAETSLAGGTAYFYAIGGTTPKAVYTDIAATSTIYSIVLDTDGSAEVYGIGQYRVVVKDADGVSQYDKDINLSAGSAYVTAPATNTDDYIPTWNGTNSGILQDGYSVATTVGAVGSDTVLVTEQGIREAITGIVGAATTTTSGTVEIATNGASGEAAAGTDPSRVITPATLNYVLSITPHVLQVVNYSSGALDTSTTVIPDDDTIPQNSEGKEWATLAITPKRNDSKLIIDVSLQIGVAYGTSVVVAALFQDTTAGALNARRWHTYNDDNGTIMSGLDLKYFMTSATTSATTFKVRFGAGGSGTAYINGTNAARKFGGVAISSITITEVLV
jgi:hypothetical protein